MPQRHRCAAVPPRACREPAVPPSVPAGTAAAQGAPAAGRRQLAGGPVGDGCCGRPADCAARRPRAGRRPGGGWPQHGGRVGTDRRAAACDQDQRCVGLGLGRHASAAAAVALAGVRPSQPNLAPHLLAGDKVTAGTVNYDGQITVQAVHSGGDTGAAGAVERYRGGLLAGCWLATPVQPFTHAPTPPAAAADIVRMVEAAQGRTAPVQRFADVVAVSAWQPFWRRSAPVAQAEPTPGSARPNTRPPHARPCRRASSRME